MCRRRARSERYWHDSPHAQNCMPFLLIKPKRRENRCRRENYNGYWGEEALGALKNTDKGKWQDV